MSFKEYIKADNFFRDYLPFIKNYKNKMRGKNGRGNPLEFSEIEKRQIKDGLKKLFNDLQNHLTTRSAPRN